MSDNNKWSIQISKSLRFELKRFCKTNGYKLSGLIEKLVLTHLSGSFGK